MKFVPDLNSGELKQARSRSKVFNCKNSTRAGHGYDPNIHSQARGRPTTRSPRKEKHRRLHYANEVSSNSTGTGQSQQATFLGNGGGVLRFRLAGVWMKFDVSNNKQHAQALNDVSKKDWMYFAEDGEKGTRSRTGLNEKTSIYSFAYKSEASL